MSFSLETIGAPAAAVQENNKPAGIIGNDPFHTSSRSSTPFPSPKEMSFAESAGPFEATLQENNKPAGLLRPNLFHKSSRSPTPFPKKKSHPTKTA